MKCDKKFMRLYAVTDRAWVGKQSLYDQVESALKGGATCVQLREKHMSDDDFLKEALEIGVALQAVQRAVFHKRQCKRSHKMQGRRHTCGSGRHGHEQCARWWATI